MRPADADGGRFRGKGWTSTTRPSPVTSARSSTTTPQSSPIPRAPPCVPPCSRAGRRGAALRVHCTESRPLCEGTVLAQDLARAGIATTLSTDSLAFSLLRQARDPVLAAGADAITAEGVINKAGTLGLATAARSWGIPFYVLAGSEKFLSGRILRRPPTGTARRGSPRPGLRGTARRQPLFRPDAPRLRHRHRHRARGADGAGRNPRTRRNGDPLSPDRRRGPGLNTRPGVCELFEMTAGVVSRKFLQ